MKKILILQAAVLVSLFGCASEKIKSDHNAKVDKTSSIQPKPPGGEGSYPPVVRPPIGLNSIPPKRPRPPGSDRDAHGCIPSAGYLWCAKTNSCERPWELAKKEGFIGKAGINETRKAFNKYCGK